MREIELKFKVSDLHALEEKLRQQGCILSEPIAQHDTIYTKDGDTSIWEHSEPGDIIVRIRQQNEKTILTLKKQLTGELDNLEYEIEVRDRETMHTILTLLDVVPMIEVKKKRRKGRLSEYEVCLDEVEGLGMYIEFEALVDDGADPAAVTTRLMEVVESIGMPAADREIRGYDTIIYQLRKSGRVG